MLDVRLDPVQVDRQKGVAKDVRMNAIVRTGMAGRVRLGGYERDRCRRRRDRPPRVTR
jgi:hypothetical protein